MAVEVDRPATHSPSGPSLPALLTVEEAAALLRIGRTKAYAMTREWRATGGRCGMPVVDFGNVLRVPLAALEEMTGARLSPPATSAAPAIAPLPRDEPEPSVLSRDEQVPWAAVNPAPARTLRSARSARSSEQLDLFDPSA